jgi:hypothetical protein
MENRIKKLVTLLESPRSSEASHLASFQLGELSKEMFGPVVLSLMPVLRHQDEAVRKLGALTLHCCIAKAEVKVISEKLVKRHCTDYSLDDLLDDLRGGLSAESWETKQGSLLGLHALVIEVSLPVSLRASVIDELIYILADDNVADYSADLPVFPVREICAEVLAVIAQGQPEVESRLVQLAETLDNCLGPLMALRLLSSPASFWVLSRWYVLHSLSLSEDVVTEACRIAATLEYPPNFDLEALTTRLSEVMNASDDLSPAVEFIIKALCKLSIETDCGVLSTVDQTPVKGLMLECSKDTLVILRRGGRWTPPLS